MADHTAVPAPLEDRREAPRRQSDVALAEVLNSMKVELAELAVCGERLQEILGVAIQHAGRSPDPALIEEAQGLDRMVQRLSALSAFIEAVAPDMPAAWRLDVDAALDALPLSDLAGRLGRRDVGVRASAGDLDLF
jgi:hypothetical protein